MKVLITGASSKIGSKLITSLKTKEVEIVALTHRQTINNSIKQIPVDILDSAGLDKSVKDVDVVIHLAALTHSHDQKKYFQVNHVGTKNLIKACQKNNIKRFIFVSTRSIGQKAGAYGYSKYLAEQEVKKSGLDWIIFRPAEAYGLGGKESIDRLINECQQNLIVPIPGNGSYLLSPVYYQDVVDVLVKAIIDPRGYQKTYTVCGPQSYQYKELAELIVQMLNQKKIYVHIPLFILKFISSFKIFFYQDQVPRLTAEKLTDISELKNDYGYEPINIISYLNQIKNG